MFRKFICLMTIVMLGIFGTATADSSSSAKQKIVDGIYTNSINNGPIGYTYSVKIPPATLGKDSFRTMGTKEIDYGGGLSYASFGPTDFDSTIYRVSVIPRSEKTFEDNVKTFFPQTLQNAEAYGQPTKLIKERYLKFKGHSAYYAVFTQNIPGKYVFQLGGKSPDAVLTHGTYMIDYGQYIVVLWVQGSSYSFTHAVKADDTKQFLDGTWPQEVVFVNSFQFNVKPK